ITTPFRADDVAPERLQANLRRWNATALKGYVVLGSTGEFPMLSEAERDQILIAAREAIPKEKAFIAGTGTNSTLHTIRQTKRAAELGADAEMGVAVKYLIGTMIEVPRAALIAGEIARTAEFFSFGTNDLTQLTFGYSRDDVAKFLPEYLQKGLLPNDPFSVLDQEGVGELIRIGIERGRRARPDLKVGICGEHGGEPASVE